MRWFRRRPTREAELLAAAPGPSPWFFKDRVPGLEGHLGPYSWISAGDERPFAGKTLLRRGDGLTVGVLGFYCYVLPLGGSRFVLWHRLDRPADPLMPHAMRFRVVDAENLSPLSSLRAACEWLDESDGSTYLEDRWLAEATITTAWEPGVCPLHWGRTPFRHVPELLVLARASDHGAVRTAIAPMSLCLWIMRPAADTLEVVPQDWFNQGPYDFGYQWVTRLVRDPTTGRILGEGMRMPPFELDATNRQIARLLPSDE